MKPVVFDFQDCLRNDVWELRCLAFSAGNTAALNTVVRSYVGGVFSHVIKICHEAFEAGVDLDDTISEMMRDIFEARLVLMESIPSCPDDDKFRRMIAHLQGADENLSKFSSAVLIIDDETYSNIVDCRWWMVTGDEWFCGRQRLDEAVPTGVAEFLLRADRRSSETEAEGS